MSLWYTRDINSGISQSNRDKCMTLAQQNVDNTVGILWNHRAGFCRSIFDAEPYLPWPNFFPDGQSSIKTCILNSVITGQGTNYKSCF